MSDSNWQSKCLVVNITVDRTDSASGSPFLEVISTTLLMEQSEEIYTLFMHPSYFLDHDFVKYMKHHLVIKIVVLFSSIK